MKIVQQHDVRDCGAACLSMIASYYGLNMPISKYRELTKTDRIGANIYGIADGASKIGLAAEALSGEPDDLHRGIDNREITFPFIAHTVNEDSTLHFVVVFSFNDSVFLIGDPAQGKIKMTDADFFNRWTGYIITFRKTDSFRPDNLKKNSFSKFILLMKGQQTKLIGILVCSIIIAAIGIAGAFVFQIAIDNFTAEQGYVNEHTHNHFDTDEIIMESTDSSEEDSAFDIEEVLSQITDLVGNNFHLIFAAVLCLYLLQGGIQFIRGCLIVSLSRTIDLRLTLSYYNHIVDLPVSSIAARQTGEYMSRFSDSATIRQAISGATLTLMLDSVMAVIGGLMLYVENRRLFLISLIVVILYAIIFLLYRKPMERSNRSVMENNARLQSYFKESIDGMETVKASSAEDHVKNTTSGKFHSFLNSVVRNSMISISQDTLANTIELVGTVLILWAGFIMVLNNSTTIGALMTFYALLGYFTQPVKNLIELQPLVQTAVIAADRLSDILDLQTEEKTDEPVPMSSTNVWEFRNVDFRYGNRGLTLAGIDFSIIRGEKIAIVGESGSGKTTLAKLLLRFYSPEKGDILLDGEDINNFNISSLRKSIGYVDQNVFLFSDTIENNLKLGNADISNEDMEFVCKLCNADEFISSLPLGYQTPLDENGANLSGGQRQRLAIARALLKKPQLLILDEATSHLDMATEMAIKNAIFDPTLNLTCIIIAHRMATVKNCDHIYVMDKGRIIESGTHDELKRKGGKYYQLCQQ